MAPIKASTLLATALVFFTCSILIGSAQQYEEDYSAETRYANWQSTKTSRTKDGNTPSPFEEKNSSPDLAARNRPRNNYEGEPAPQYAAEELPRGAQRQRTRHRTPSRPVERRADDTVQTAQERRRPGGARFESTTFAPQPVTPRLRVPVQEEPAKLPRGFSLDNRRQGVRQEVPSTDAVPVSSSPRPFSRGRVKARIVDNPRKSKKEDDVNESDNYPPGFVERLKTSDVATAEPRRSRLRQRAAKTYPAIALSEGNRFRQRYIRVSTTTESPSTEAVSQGTSTEKQARKNIYESRQRSRVHYTTSRTTTTTAESKPKPFRSYGRRITSTQKNLNFTQVYTTTVGPRQKYLERLRAGNKRYKTVKTTTEKAAEEEKKEEALEPAENLLYLHPNESELVLGGGSNMKNVDMELKSEASEEDTRVDTSKATEKVSEMTVTTATASTIAPISSTNPVSSSVGISSTNSVRSSVGTSSTNPITSSLGISSTNPVSTSVGISSTIPVSSSVGTSSTIPVSSSVGTSSTIPVSSSVGISSTNPVSSTLGVSSSAGTPFTTAAIPTATQKPQAGAGIPATRHRFSSRFSRSNRTTISSDIKPTIPATASLVAEKPASPHVNLTSLFDDAQDSTLSMTLLNNSFAASSTVATNKTISPTITTTRPSTITVNSSTNTPSPTNTTSKRPKKKSQKKKGRKSRKTTTPSPVAALGNRPILRNLALFFAAPEETTIRKKSTRAASPATTTTTTTTAAPTPQEITQIQTYINETMELVQNKTVMATHDQSVPRVALDALTPETSAEETTARPDTTTSAAAPTTSAPTTKAAPASTITTTTTATTSTTTTTTAATTSTTTTEAPTTSTTTTTAATTSTTTTTTAAPTTSTTTTTAAPTSTTTATAAPTTAARATATTTAPPAANCTSQFVYFDYNSTTPIPQQAANSRAATTPTTTTSTTADYFVYGVYPNNTVVRKRAWKTFDYERYHSPYVIFGIYPNNTIVKKFPNGTVINDEYMTSDNEVRDVTSSSTPRTTSAKPVTTTKKEEQTTAEMRMSGSFTTENTLEEEKVGTTENPDDMFEIFENEIQRAVEKDEKFEIATTEATTETTTETQGETTTQVLFLEEVEATTTDGLTTKDSREGKSLEFNDIFGENIAEGTTEKATESTTTAKDDESVLSKENVVEGTTERITESTTTGKEDGSILSGENIIEGTTERITESTTTGKEDESLLFRENVVDGTTERVTESTTSRKEDGFVVSGENIVEGTTERITESTTADIEDGYILLGKNFGINEDIATEKATESSTSRDEYESIFLNKILSTVEDTTTERAATTEDGTIEKIITTEKAADTERITESTSTTKEDVSSSLNENVVESTTERDSTTERESTTSQQEEEYILLGKILGIVKVTTTERTTTETATEGTTTGKADSVLSRENFVESTTERESTTSRQEEEYNLFARISGSVEDATTERATETATTGKDDSVLSRENFVESTTERESTTSRQEEEYNLFARISGSVEDATTERATETATTSKDDSVLSRENFVESTTERESTTSRQEDEYNLFGRIFNLFEDGTTERATESTTNSGEGESILLQKILSSVEDTTTERAAESTTTSREEDLFGRIQGIEIPTEQATPDSRETTTEKVSITTENSREGKSFSFNDLFGENVVESTTPTAPSQIVENATEFIGASGESTTERGFSTERGYSTERGISTERGFSTEGGSPFFIDLFGSTTESPQRETTEQDLLARIELDPTARSEQKNADIFDLQQLFQLTTTRYDSSLSELNVRLGDGPVYRPSPTEAVEVSTATRSLFGLYEDSALSTTVEPPANRKEFESLQLATEAPTAFGSLFDLSERNPPPTTTDTPTTERVLSTEGKVPEGTTIPPAVLNEVTTLSGDLIQDVKTSNTKPTDELDHESGIVNLAFRALGSSNTITPAPTPTPNYITSTMKSTNYAIKKVKMKMRKKSTTTDKPGENLFIVTPETAANDKFEFTKKPRVKFVTLTPGVVVTTDFRDGNDIITLSSQHVQKVTKAPASIPDSFFTTVVGQLQQESSTPLQDIVKNVEEKLKGNGLSVSLARRIIEMAIERAVSTEQPKSSQIKETTMTTPFVPTTSAVVPTTQPTTVTITTTTETTTALSNPTSTANIRPLSVFFAGGFTDSTTKKMNPEDLKILTSLWVDQPQTTTPKSTTAKTVKKTKSSRNSAASTLSENDKLLLEAILKQQNSDLSVQELDKIIGNQIRLAEEVRKASKNLKKKPRVTTTTTTTTQTPPLFGFLISLFSGNSSPSNIPVTRAPIKQTRSRLKSSRAPGSMTNTPKSINPDPLKEAEAGSQSGERSTRGELVTAAIDVTKAVSKFMGTFLSSAAQSFQAFFSNLGRGR